MRYLTLGELIELHNRIIEQSGGADGIRDLGLNGFELNAAVDDSESVILCLAAGELERELFTE